MTDLIEITNVTCLGNNKVECSFRFFDGKVGSAKIEFNPKHKYAKAKVPVVEVNGKPINLFHKSIITIKKKGKCIHEDKVFLPLLAVLKHGWKYSFTEDETKVDICFKKSASRLNWKKNNKELRDFLIGVIAIAKERGIITNNTSFKNEMEIQAELWRLCKNTIEQKGLEKKLECRLEVEVEGEFVDFLIKKDGKNCILIECKPSDRLEEGVGQVKRYAKKLGVKYYGVCTEHNILLIEPRKKEFQFSEKGIEEFINYLQ